MNIIVTTPKRLIAEAAREVDAVMAAGGREYFRRFRIESAPRIEPGERVYYVEDGYVRGFAEVSLISSCVARWQHGVGGRWYDPGFYIFMDATTWKWIKPIPMRSFGAFRYANQWAFPEGTEIEIVGDWLDPKPEAAA